MSDIKEQVINIVAENLGVEKSKITEESSFVDDLGADSLDQVELVMELESSFNIEIPDDVAEKMRTVKDVLKYIEENLS